MGSGAGHAVDAALSMRRLAPRLQLTSLEDQADGRVAWGSG